MKEIRSVPQGRGLLALYMERGKEDARSGLVRAEATGVTFRFSSLAAMAMLTEQLLDLPEEALPEPGPAPAENPDFEVEILFRQNYSWQGRFRPVGESRWENFHSVLELLTLLESALTE